VDLSVVTTRLRLGDYYRNKDMMRADLLRMVSVALPCNLYCAYRTDV
jgi:hypothetical protein